MRENNDERSRVSYEPSEELVQTVNDLQNVVDSYLSLTLPSHVVWENETLSATIANVTNSLSINQSKPKMTAQLSPASSRSPSPTKGNSSHSS